MCEQVGPEITAALVLLQLKSFFNEVAFAYEHSRGVPVPQMERMSNSLPSDISSSHLVSMSVPDVFKANAEDTSTSFESVTIV